MTNSIITKNLKIISYKDLPEQIKQSLTKAQNDCLAFAVKKFKISGEPRIQTFHTGSTISGKGAVSNVGVNKSLGENWGVFGSIGNIELNQISVNTFRTDIHLRLEDIKTGDKTFFEKSLPLALTFSVEQGDEILAYFVIGGLKHPFDEDFNFKSWTPFFFNVVETGQIIPLSSIPSLKNPTAINGTFDMSFNNFLGSLGLIFGLFLVWISFSISSGILLTLGGLSFFLPYKYLYKIKELNKQWHQEYMEAKKFASNIKIKVD